MATPLKLLKLLNLQRLPQNRATHVRPFPLLPYFSRSPSYPFPVTALMSTSKPKPEPKPKPKAENLAPDSLASTLPSLPIPTLGFHGRDGLGAYITSPSSYPNSRVISYSDSFVVLNDLFPKSSIHLLLLPRDPSTSLLHPFEALSDPTFLAKLKPEVAKLKALAAKELKRRFGTFSTLQQAHETALLDQENGFEGSLPPSRDYSIDVMAGIHAGPSMSHLHIHILSRDFHSPCMKHRKHYNSFHTPFFIDVEDFPLQEDDPRRHPGREGYLSRDFMCWRCGKGFGKRFKALKDHLDDEFEAWKRI